MNKTERILGMLSKAAELQNSTAQMIGVARLNIDELLKLIEQVRKTKVDFFVNYKCRQFNGFNRQEVRSTNAKIASKSVAWFADLYFL